MRDSLHGDKLKRRQRELRSWAEGAASLHVLNQLSTTVDEFLQVHPCSQCSVPLHSVILDAGRMLMEMPMEGLGYMKVFAWHLPRHARKCERV